MQHPDQPLLPDGVAISPDRRLERASVRLSRPVKHGARELEVLELGPLKGAHVRRAPSDWNSTDQALRFGAELCALPDSVLDQLAGPDVGAVCRAVLAVSWPMLDLPLQWEEVWRVQAEATGAVPRALPAVRDGYELELEHRVQVERETTTRLTFRELTGKVARQCPLDGLPISRLPWLVGELAGVRREVVDQLEGRDLNRALSLACLFFLSVRATGEPAAPSSPSASAGDRETSTS